MDSPLTSYNCAEKLLSSGYMSDVTFYVGENKANSTRFPAHKLFLSFSSPVFSAMLGDKFVENETREVLITDVTPLAFNALLRFIYSDEFNEKITTVEYANILFAAKKYKMEPLTNRCLQKLAERTVNFKNFWTYYNIINNYFCEQMPIGLVINTLNFLSANSVELLSGDECVNLSSDIVGKIVESKAVKVDSEITVINFILNWTKMECYRQQLDVTFDNRRKVLGDIIYKIRFLTLSVLELKNQSELLSKTERDDILIPILIKKYNVEDKANDEDEGNEEDEDEDNEEDEDEDNEEDEDDDNDNDEKKDILFLWNNNLLAKRRNGYDNDSFYWIGDFSTTADPPRKNYRISIISLKVLMFRHIRLTASPHNEKLIIKSQIKKLNGEVLKHVEHDFESCKTNLDVKLDLSICLKAYTCYILDMEFENGTLSRHKYDLHHCPGDDETPFMIEELPELTNSKQYLSEQLEYLQSCYEDEETNSKEYLSEQLEYLQSCYEDEETNSKEYLSEQLEYLQSCYEDEETNSKEYLSEQLEYLQSCYEDEETNSKEYLSEQLEYLQSCYEDEENIGKVVTKRKDFFVKEICAYY